MGAINLNNTGSGSAITLSSDGSSLLLNGSAVGGGGGGGDPDLYRDNASSATTPVASGANAVAIGDGATSSGADAVTIGSGTASGSYAVALGDNRAIASGDRSFAVGNSLASAESSTALNIGMNNSGFGATNAGAFAAMQQTKASGAHSLAMGYGSVASNTSSYAIGFSATCAGYQAVSLGKSYSHGTASLAAVIDNNTNSYGATGANSIAMGYQAKATNQYGIAIGYQAQAIGGGGGVAIGRAAKASNNAISIGENGWGGGTNHAQGQGSIAIGQNNLAQKTASVVIGMHGKADVVGKYVYSNGYLSGQGNAQTGTFVLISDTTDATAEALTTDNSTAGTSNQIVLPNNSAYAFSGTIVARQKASEGTASAAWKVEGLIRREGSAGTTVLVNSATTVLDNTPSWGMALSADTTNGCLKIAVNGAASTNIRWVGTITTSEVTYA